MIISIIEQLTFYIGLFGYIVIYWGIVKSLYYFFFIEFFRKQEVHRKAFDQMRLMLSKYLSFGLEIFIGKDIVETILSPSWQEIERLGAVVTIRIVMNYFLNRDIKSLTTKE